MGLQRIPFTVDALAGVDGSTNQPIVVLTFDHGHGNNAFVFAPDEARTFAAKIIAAASDLVVAEQIPPVKRNGKRPTRARTAD